MRKSTVSSVHLNVIGILLILLSLSSYFLAEGHFKPAQPTALLLFLAAFKSFLIGAIFMELTHSHKLILLFFSFFFAVLAGLLGMLFGF